MRSLATIREVLKISPIDGADAIECATVDGWECVVKKGEFTEGERCVYFEIDSFLPASDARFEFMKKAGVKKDPSGEERIRLRTMRMRGQLSQGLALPLSMFPEFSERPIGDCLDEELNITKYERPEPKSTEAGGIFPYWLHKSDEERIQNCFGKVKLDYQGEEFIPTLKMDGSSMTVAYLPFSHRHAVGLTEETAFRGDDGWFVLCSRNMMLKFNPNSHFWKAFEKEDLVTKLPLLRDGKSIAIQGECVGPGINGGREKLNDFQFFAFNLFDIEHQVYVPWVTASDMMKRVGVKQVQSYQSIHMDGISSVKELLDMADGRSINNDNREGLVFKLKNEKRPAFSFKAISNRYLIAHKE